MFRGMWEIMETKAEKTKVVEAKEKE